MLFNEDGSVKGVATGDMGVAADGSQKADYMRGMEIHGKYTFFGEGVRGHLTKQLIPKFDLDKDREPQVYGIGVKELWDIPAEQHKQGRVIHSQGWPVKNSDGFGGGFFIPSSQQPGGLGLCGVAGIFQPLSFALRIDAAMENTSGDR